MMDQSYKRMLEACTNAAKKFPYYGPALNRCRVVKDNEHVPTMGMDQNLVLAYNDDFIKDKSNDELLMLIIHEILHYLSNHHARELEYIKVIQDASHEEHNIAMDIEINQHLEGECSYIKETGMTPEKFEYPRGKCYEDYLKMLLADKANREQELKKSGKLQEMMSRMQSALQNAMSAPGAGNKSGSDANGNSDDDDQNSQSDSKSNSNGDKPTKDPRNMTKEEILDSLIMKEKLKMAVINLNKASTSAKAKASVNRTNTECENKRNELSSNGIGSDSALNKLIREVPKKKYSWKEVLRNVLRSKVTTKIQGCDCTTYEKYNRRMTGVAKDIIFGTKYSYRQTYDLVVGVDVSGSMGNLTTEMYSYLKSIKDHLDDDAELHVTIAECDTCIGNVIEDFDTTSKSVESCSGGGTDMDAIIRWVDEEVTSKKRKSPDLIIIMTDNEVCWDKPNPKWKNKIIVMTNQPSTDCPYKQYNVLMPEGKVAVQASA